MIFTQYYLECLSHASYLIGDESSGRAVVVDPQRDVGQYVADAAEQNLTIERVIETHFHADFVSGHLELAAQTGAVVSYGDRATADFPIDGLADGQHLSLGEVVLEIRHTPGHTPESISIVVCERPDDEAPYAVLTGDTLFIGDVGRPDLLTSVGVSADELARDLYRSLHEQLLTLPDSTRVFPAHGAGSACGKQLSTETQSTIGEQRTTNYALAPMSETEFVAAVTEGQSIAPAYFAYSAQQNKAALPVRDDAPLPSLALEEVLTRAAAGAVLLDTRAPATFAAGHLAGSVNVGLAGRFAEYAGAMIGPEDDIILISDPGTEVEARLRLARIGFDRVVGFLPDPDSVLLDRPDLARRSSRLTAAELSAARAADPSVQVVDVRNPGETRLGALPGAQLVPLALVTARMDEFDPARPIVVYCEGGYRSSIAASTLRAAGRPDVSDLVGGYGAWLSYTNGVGADGR